MPRLNNHATLYDEKEPDALNGPQDMLTGGTEADYSEIDVIMARSLSQLDPVGKKIEGGIWWHVFVGTSGKDTIWGWNGNGLDLWAKRQR